MSTTVTSLRGSSAALPCLSMTPASAAFPEVNVVANLVG